VDELLKGLKNINLPFTMREIHVTNSETGLAESQSQTFDNSFWPAFSSGVGTYNTGALGHT
jgi:hypothetical protein